MTSIEELLSALEDVLESRKELREDARKGGEAYYLGSKITTAERETLEFGKILADYIKENTPP